MSQGAAGRDPLKLFFADFVASARTTLERLESGLAGLRDAADQPAAMRLLERGFHALKGNASFFEDAAITPLGRAAEEAVERLAEQGCPATPEMLDLLGRVIERLGHLVEVSAAAGEPVRVGVEDEALILALEAITPFHARSRYLFWGADVTEEVRLLAAVADHPAGDGERGDGMHGDGPAGAGAVDSTRTRAAAAAVDRLSRLARAADVHDVARAIEAAMPRGGTVARDGKSAHGAAGVAPDQDAALDGGAVRAALRLLAPMLQRIGLADPPDPDRD